MKIETRDHASEALEKIQELGLELMRVALVFKNYEPTGRARRDAENAVSHAQEVTRIAGDLNCPSTQPRSRWFSELEAAPF